MARLQDFLRPLKWWEIEAQELQEQENNYAAIKLTESYRGRAFLVVFILGLFSVFLGFVLQSIITSIAGSFVAFLSVFIYRGSKWVMLFVMVLWTLQMIYTLPLSPYVSIIAWFLVMGPLFKAWKLEKTRKPTIADLGVKRTHHKLPILVFVMLATLTALVVIAALTPAAIKARFDETGIALDGSTALHHAAFYGDAERVQALLNSGADVNAVNKLGETPLHRAVMSENIRTMTVLLDNGADINAVKVTGMTPLNKAVYFGKTAAAIFLIQHGADTSIKDNQGNSPLDTARNKNNSELIKTLSSPSHL